MKKVSFFLCTSFIIAILFMGCNYNLGNMIFSKNKPNNFYYTNILAKNLTLEASCKCLVLDTNLYKEKELKDDSISTVKNMLKTLTKNNFIPKPKNLPEKPLYKIFLTFSKDKLVINVYNEHFVSIYPWDGDYEMDYIDMSSLPKSLNLYNLSSYIFK